MTQTLLTRDAILNAPDLTTEAVEVKEWGGTVLVSTMTGYARDQFENSIIGKKGGTNNTNIRAKLAAATIVDEEGAALFSEADIAKLGKKSGAALGRVFDVAMRLNGMTDSDVDELAKN